MEAHFGSPSVAELPHTGADAYVAPDMRLTPAVQALLRCPACQGRLAPGAGQLRCLAEACGALYPVVGGIPVLINEPSSLFALSDFTSQQNTYFKRESALQRAVKRATPRISKNVKCRQNYARLAGLLLQRSRAPRVLVLGGSVPGHGLEILAEHPAIELVESDVAFGPRTMLIGDAHDIPFEPGAFDGLIVQGVISALVDPYRAVAEIHRVLKPAGLVYAETAFVQQVVGGPYDFTRFTHLGHRRLFRKFEEIESGAVCGPGMALAWSYEHFLLSFAATRPLRKALRVFARLTSFYLKYFDQYLIDKPGTLDAASAFYFIGSKADRPLPDRKLIGLYRGLT